MTFKQWLRLNEAGTSTADIAGFSRPIMPLVRRLYHASMGGKVEPMRFNAKTIHENWPSGTDTDKVFSMNGREL